MKVCVHLHTILQRTTPEGIIDRLEVELVKGATITNLLAQLEIELSPQAMILAINGRVAFPQSELTDGDRVNLMPAISGGQGIVNISNSNLVPDRWAGCETSPISLDNGQPNNR